MIENGIGACGSCTVCDAVRPHEQAIHLVELAAFEMVLTNVRTHIGNAGNTGFPNKIAAGIPPGLRILIQIREERGAGMKNQAGFWKLPKEDLFQRSILRFLNGPCGSAESLANLLQLLNFQIQLTKLRSGDF